MNSIIISPLYQCLREEFPGRTITMIGDDVIYIHGDEFDYVSMDGLEIQIIDDQVWVRFLSKFNKNMQAYYHTVGKTQELSLPDTDPFREVIDILRRQLDRMDDIVASMRAVSPKSTS